MVPARDGAARKKVLVVEDETDIRTLLEYTLERDDLEVRGASDGHAAFQHLNDWGPDLVVLDLMLPDLSGLEILKAIRSSRELGRVKVFILSAKSTEEDRIRGLQVGADDYITKPFSPKELMLRIRRALERPEPAGDADPDVRRLVVGPIEIEEAQHVARVSGQVVYLTLTEFRLLADLVRNQGRVRSRESLMAQVWSYDSEAMSRTVDTHVRRLRTKLGPAASWLTTVRGVGYRLCDPEQAAGPR